MSMQPLSAKSVRRIQRSLDRDEGAPRIARAWTFGSHVMSFLTPDHKHGWWDKKTEEWGFELVPLHLSSCRAYFDGLAENHPFCQNPRVLPEDRCLCGRESGNPLHK